MRQAKPRGRVRAVGAILSIMAIVGSLSAGHAGLQRPTLRCWWSGTMYYDVDNNEADLLLTLGPGQGTCGFDGSGPYTITAMTGSGVLSDPVGLFDFDVHFQVRRVGDGRFRSFDQTWSGLLTNVFVAIGNKNRVGAGTYQGVGCLCYENQVSFEWIFV